MDFEVVFLLNGKEVARYRLPAEAPVDFQADVGDAIDARVRSPEVDLLGDGVLVQIQKVGR